MRRAASGRSPWSVRVTCRNGEEKQYWLFTKVVRLKKYGEKRVVIVHEQEERQGRRRAISHRCEALGEHAHSRNVELSWTSEVFHAFDKQVCGMEAAQVRKEEAVIRHFRLSCVAQSLIQRAPVVASKSERYEFAEGRITFGQKCRTISREVSRAMLALCQRYFAEGKTCDHVLELLMPV